MRPFAAFVLLCLGAIPAIAATAPQIALPALLAMELSAGQHEIAPTDAALHDLLASAHSGDLRVTADLDHPIVQGAARVTWTAWRDEKPVATRAATIFVLPHGMTPVGVSGDENATGGNNSVKIARDADGHVHMVWVNSGIEGMPGGPFYRGATVAADGTVTFDGPPVLLAGNGPADWNSYPALAVTGHTVQFVWQGGGTLRTRALINGVWSAPRDTGLKSEGRDVGPVVVASGDLVHVATPGGLHAVSTDGGQSWKPERIPLPPGGPVKTISMALEPSGTLHVAFSFVVRSNPPSNKSGGNGNYWQLRSIVRSPEGVWSDAKDVLAGIPGWTVPPPDQDALADWVRVAVDAAGNTHLVWHGTAVSHIYAHDQSWYAQLGKDGALTTPVALVPPDPASGINFSFAPSLTLDGSRAYALTFYDVIDGPRWAGFDARLVALRDGKAVGNPLQITDLVSRAIVAKRPEDVLSNRFPAAAPSLFRTSDGHAWLDVVETLIPMGVDGAPRLIVYQRVDLTAAHLAL